MLRVDVIGSLYFLHADQVKTPHFLRGYLMAR